MSRVATTKPVVKGRYIESNDANREQKRREVTQFMADLVERGVEWSDIKLLLKNGNYEIRWIEYTPLP